jgi:ligand-binding sensor domain-containing protein
MVRSARRLFALRKDATKFVAEDDGLPNGSALAGRIVAAPGQAGVMVPTNIGQSLRENGRWQIIDATRGLSGHTTCCVLYDREGSIWVGVVGTGLNRWLGYKQWESWTKDDGLSNNSTWTIKKDRHGTLGVNFRDAKTGRWHALHERDGLRGETIEVLAIDDHDEIWAGGLPGGVSRISDKGKVVASYGAEAGLTSDRVWACSSTPRIICGWEPMAVSSEVDRSCEKARSDYILRE